MRSIVALDCFMIFSNRNPDGHFEKLSPLILLSVMQRRLLLLNDLLLCVTVNGRSSEVDFNSVSSANNNERLSLKWAVPVGDVEIVGEFSDEMQLRCEPEVA